MVKLFKYRHKTIAICFALMLGFTTAATAAPITMWSGDGGDVLVNSVTGAGPTVTITPHSVWGNVSVPAGLSPGTAQWISYANTGVGGIVPPNASGLLPGNETMHFSRSFTTMGGAFDVWILSDDTAAVQLTKVGDPTQTLYNSFPGLIHPCSPGGTSQPIGCVQVDIGHAAIANLAPGTYSLDFYGFQRGGDVAGMNYAFRYQQAQQVPEPTSLGLLGLGLVFTAGTLRRRVLRR